MVARGHDILFLERNLKWYAANRDLPKPPYGRTHLYHSLPELKKRFTTAVRQADCVIVGSYVQDGAAIGQWVTQLAEGVTAFYDIDTPVTLARLERGDLDYLSRALIPAYQLYLSFTGGPTLQRLEQHYGSPMARALYCSVDPELYSPQARPVKWDLGYMGTYSPDRQPELDRLLLEPARHWHQGRFAVAGPQFPKELKWPHNVKRTIYLSPARHRAFYNAQRFTLNLTRSCMVAAGWSPSARLFEAAACGTPIITDYWQGLDEFFKPDEEILIARSGKEVLKYLQALSESERRLIAERARERVLAAHTAGHRAAELEGYIYELFLKSAVF